MTNKPLTEMEGGTLAMIHDQQPCTAYAIADTFANSPSSFWSGSAGAVYPMMERLHKRGLLKARASATGKRKSKLYSLSKAGETAFRENILDASRAANPGFDPLRSRLLQLGQFTRKEQLKFLTEVEANINEEGKSVLADDSFGPELKRIHKSWLKHRLSWVARLIKEAQK